MAAIFVTYADREFREAAARLRRRARKMGLFDKVLVYTPKQLPDYILSSPLYKYSRGGGYWCWKPYILQDALSKCEMGDVIYYADSGCVLNPTSEEWRQWAEEMRTHNAIFFQYRKGYHYALWDRYCADEDNNNARILHWTKPLAAQWLTDYVGDEHWLEDSKIWGGACILKKVPSCRLIDEWLRITIAHPEIIMDPQPEEGMSFPKTFNVHRHDQVILTALVHKYKEEERILVLSETSESQRGSAAIRAERYRTGKMSLWETIKYYLYLVLHPDF